MGKIIRDRTYGEIVGGHIVAPKAAELIEELVIARELEGGYSELAHSIHPHPAFAEAVLEAARGYRWVVDPQVAADRSAFGAVCG